MKINSAEEKRHKQKKYKYDRKNPEKNNIKVYFILDEIFSSNMFVI